MLVALWTLEMFAALRDFRSRLGSRLLRFRFALFPIGKVSASAAATAAATPLACAFALADLARAALSSFRGLLVWGVSHQFGGRDDLVCLFPGGPLLRPPRRTASLT